MCPPVKTRQIKCPIARAGWPELVLNRGAYPKKPTDTKFYICYKKCQNEVCIWKRRSLPFDYDCDNLMPSEILIIRNNNKINYLNLIISSVVVFDKL